MSILLSIACCGLGCSNVKELESTVDECDSDVNAFIDKGKWIYDGDNDAFYCNECAPEVAKELGIQYPNN